MEEGDLFSHFGSLSCEIIIFQMRDRESESGFRRTCL